MSGFIKSFRHLFTQSSGSVDYYNAMNTDIVGLNGTNNTSWMSTGFWKSANNYNDACRDLADLIAEESQLNEFDTLLDLGCGCGEQDFHWKSNDPRIKITALDVTPLHIEIANKRAASENSDIQFQVGDACEIAFENNTFSKVIALDCAFHFSPRTEFFAEAYRVLKKGGTLAVTDMLPARNEYFNSKGQVKRRKSLFIPEGNMYDIEQYTQYLQAAGFKDIVVKQLSEPVYGGMARYYVQRYLHPQTTINQLYYNFNRKLWGKLGKRIFHTLYGTSEYVLVIART